VLNYPATPQEFKDTHPDLYKRFYKDSEAITCPINGDALNLLRERMPSRKNNKGVGLPITLQGLHVSIAIAKGGQQAAAAEYCQKYVIEQNMEAAGVSGFRSH
jgi:hypothetical protein